MSELKNLPHRVWDWDKDGSHNFIGETQANLNFLQSNFRAELENTNKKVKKIGILKVVELKSTLSYSLLDYMIGGLDMSLMVAIDFTGSNGHPANPQSLHYLITKLWKPLTKIKNQKLKKKKKGAKFSDGSVSHDFALNGNEADPEVSGIHGIEEVYIKALKSVQLYGPTYFNAILQKAIAIATAGHSNAQKKMQYFTLLILTDGVINDFKETKDLLVFFFFFKQTVFAFFRKRRGCTYVYVYLDKKKKNLLVLFLIVMAANKYLPLSIIIVGVGLADFSQMTALDGDDGGLRNSKGVPAKRDIVQFVSLREYSQPITNEAGQVIGFTNTRFADLSKETLRELPEQCISYAKFHKLLPP
ncbi:copine III [Reticulomyxa filosa]|uniref:Copine III n=1 Tax=Reticulomyxa filosa TaxID=46433 RepID=X6MNK3_RETFI|nr:copine III [Reticulomyxa filosa]|eukprot:ETO15007.1 copine III [Reticulomyxa filosa]